jgi:hypothetical protein
MVHESFVGKILFREQAANSAAPNLAAPAVQTARVPVRGQRTAQGLTKQQS